VKISAFILKRNRTIAEVRVSPDDPTFNYKAGTYVVDKTAVNISADRGHIASLPELYYIEGNPFPLATDAQPQDTIEFLDEVVLENALSNLSGPPSQFAQLVLDYMRDPKKLIILGFAVVLAYSFISGLLF